MTIIRPHKRKHESSRALLISIAVLLSILILSVFFYNANVDLRYMTETIETEIDRLQAENAELKDTLFRRLDFENIDELTDRLGLVKDNSPEYLLAFQ